MDFTGLSSVRVTLGAANVAVNVTWADGDGDFGTVKNFENVIGTDDADEITGHASTANIIEGGLGADELLGQIGATAALLDTVSYAGSDAAVNVNLDDVNVESGGHAEGDTLSGFTHIIGSAIQRHPECRHRRHQDR